MLVFDGRGSDETHGPLEVRFAEHADSLIERLASENRDRERVCVVSTDVDVRATAGRLVQTLTSQTFLARLRAGRRTWRRSGAELADRLDAETRARSNACAAAASRLSVEHTFLSNKVHRKVLVKAWTVCYLLPQPEGETSSRRPTSGG